jgi:hypothetical protein
MKDDRIEEVFERLEEIRVDLDYDPLVRGPKFLTNQVANCRNFTNEVQTYVRECQRYIRTVEAQLRRGEADYELSYNDLLANDPEILAMRKYSRVDREAAVSSKLSEERTEIMRLERDLTDAKHVETVISDKLKELRDTMSAIRLQRDLIKAEIEVGSYWGTEGSDSNKHHDHAAAPASTQKEPSEASLIEALSEPKPREEYVNPKLSDDDLDLDALFKSASDKSTSKKDLKAKYGRNTTENAVDSSNAVLTFRSTGSTVPSDPEDLDPITDEDFMLSSQITDIEDFDSVLQGLS